MNIADMNKCYCGYSIDRVAREVKVEQEPPRPAAAMTTTSFKPSDSDAMIGKSLYQRKQRVAIYLWMYGIMIGVGLVLLLISVTDDRDPKYAFGLIGMGTIFFIHRKVLSRKPTVILYDDYFEVNQTKLHLIRYCDILKVERPEGKRVLTVTARTEDGTSQITNILLFELEDEDGEHLTEFLLQKAPSA